MKRTISKSLAMLLSIIMLISAVPVFADPAESGSCGENVTYAFNETSGELVISGTGDMAPYGRRGWDESAFYPNSPFFLEEGVKSVVINEGVTSLGQWTFAGCKNLESVQLPLSLKEIGERAFIGCVSLKEINIPEGVETINASTFYNCSALKEVNIPSGVKNIGEDAFYNCISLTDINISEGLEVITENAFANCSSLENIELPESLTEIQGNAFKGCASLKSLSIPKNVAKIGYTKYSRSSVITDCPAITELNVDSENKAYDSRENCNAIIDSNEDLLINGCCNTVVPNGISKIGYEAFCGCKNLKSIDIPDGADIASRAFADCSSLQSIKLPKGLKSITMYMLENCSSLKSLEIPDTVKRIYTGALFGCKSLKTLTIPDSVTEVDASIWYCDNLESVKLSKNITELNRPFKYCKKLKKIEIPGKVKKIETLCENCPALETIKIPKATTEISRFAIRWCTGLKNIIVDKNNEKYSSKDGVLYSKNKTILILYPSGKKATTFRIPDSVKKIKEWAFIEAEGIKTLVVPKNVKTIDYIAFGNTTKIKSIRYEGTLLQWGAVEINEYEPDYVDGDDGDSNYIPPCYEDNYYLYKDPEPYIPEDYGVYAVKGMGNDALKKIRVYCTNGIVQGKHTYLKKNSKITKNATFKSNGSRVYKCSHCDKKITVTISKLGAPKLSKVTKKSKAFTAKWNKVSNIGGYQLQYSTSKSFKSAVKKSTSKTSLTVKGLKSGKKYYVRIRTYKTVDNKKYYSAWSAFKTVTTK